MLAQQAGERVGFAGRVVAGADVMRLIGASNPHHQFCQRRVMDMQPQNRLIGLLCIDTGNRCRNRCFPNTRCAVQRHLPILLKLGEEFLEDAVAPKGTTGTSQRQISYRSDRRFKGLKLSHNSPNSE